MSRILLVALLVLLFTVAAWGQATAGYGAISGTVRDASGAAIPGAKVTVSNPSLGLTRELTTTEAGIFAAPALVPGTGYKVSINQQGFAPYEAAGLTVLVGETVNLNIALSVGSISQQVEVTAA